MDRLVATCPHATLTTHGRAVGLPEGQMGNSEVGHTNIGAGRVVAMDLGMIDLAIEDGSFCETPALAEFIATLKDSGGRGACRGPCLARGGAFSPVPHCRRGPRADRCGLEVLVHAITDGRDVAPVSAEEQIAQLAADLPPGARIVTVSGRYFAMDRDNRWDRVQRAYTPSSTARAPPAAMRPRSSARHMARARPTNSIEPAVVEGYGGMAEGDGLFFVNFRADRAREILAAIGDPEFDGFDRGPRPPLAARLGMVDYSKAHDAYMTTIFPKQEIVNTLAEWVAKQGLRQFHIAETEKYPHVTFFLNGGKEPPVPGEDRYMAASPRVATYDLQPEMSAGEVTDHLVQAIGAGYDLIVVNYANPDMVGHTGDLAAAIKACEAVDTGLGRAVAALERAGGAMIVTADHGNCETMIDPVTGGPHTAHTLNPVPVILVGGPAGASLRDGILADLAPSLLQLMGLAQPPEMTGQSLIT